ncbi:sensor histidine kinase [Clostridium sp. AF18-27]|uniref:HAMP domain-containing sensor histidine kinase n=1 Tax=Enterocloster lavalensis TaxID=460384 RepID=UPI000E4B6FA3|nr:HAMP domain-containing sensor histidine kinase [Enterocloster lavalensis]RHR49396.1 sensor histidine kinase [Clostridium sp. AF18-27]
MIYKMKLWQKICISSLIASILLFAVCGIITTVSGHKRNLQAEENQAVWLAGQMKAEVERAYREHKDLTAPFLNPLIPEDVCFQVYRGETRLYDGFGREPETPRYDFGYEIAREPLELVTIQKVNYLFAEETLDLEGGAAESAVNGKAAPGAVAGTEPARLVLVKDLSDVYARCNAQLQTLFLLCGILSAVSALIMVTASLIITVPIKKINEAVKIVSDDYYAYRLPVTGTDELNELSANFNVMCEAIENNIRNYKFAIDNFIHEVKTPLTSIIGYADMLKSYDCTGECREEAVDYILTQSRRLNSLVKKIMGFLVIESKQVEKKFVRLDEVVNMACISVRVQAEMKELRIEYQNRPEAYMYGDEELLATLLVNLLDNSIKASGEHSQILIGAVLREDAVEELSVLDFGMGIPEEELDKLTEPFYMVDKSRSRSQNGIGLGLSICKSIIQAHNGRMEFSSTPGEGTTVRVHFPYEDYQYLRQAQDELFEKADIEG